MKLGFQIAIPALAAALLSGCESGPFDNGAAQALLDSSKLTLSGEQVLVTPDQVLCGQKKGLWTVDQIDGGGAIGRLEAPGRALQFADDVRMGDQRFTQPYVQLQGDFPIRVKKLVKMTDESESAKIVEASIGVVIEHECFKAPLVLLGVNRGDFSEDAAPRVQLRQRNGWTVDRILH